MLSGGNREVMMEWTTTKSGIIIPEYIARKPQRLTAFDFFCGCGGFSLGFMQAVCGSDSLDPGCINIDSRFEIVGANEWEPCAALTYIQNLGHYPCRIHFIEGEKDALRLEKEIRHSWGIKGNAPLDAETLNKAFGQGIAESKCAGSGWIKHQPGALGVKNFWFGDVRKLKGKYILDTLGMKQGDIDVVMGGPPCQGFSRAGKRIVGDARNNLVYEYARMIVELQPKFYIMEEVPNVLNFYDTDGVPVLDKFCMILEEGDYGKWELIKKSLLTQSCSAGVIKDRLKRHKKKLRKEKAARARELFDFDG
jgi:DNA (cytosine-5)-methyltransferase 1